MRSVHRTTPLNHLHVFRMSAYFHAPSADEDLVALEYHSQFFDESFYFLRTTPGWIEILNSRPICYWLKLTD